MDNGNEETTSASVASGPSHLTERAEPEAPPARTAKHREIGRPPAEATS